MKKIAFILIAFLLMSCKTEVKKEDLTKLNGYWEIKQVTLANGETKDYKVNETIDFFEVKNNEGFRQKVMPQLDGTYKTNGIKESLKVFEKENTYFIECKTDYGKWNEEIITIEDSTLVLKNKQNLIYTYKKYEPFSLK
ncbi:hypothetical protein IVB69_13435 [Flavobacterium sp. J49]|uniref:hypothetical protein n=1 Tax=Flavobacterium sp. J49 TaxID=2718534 RepID=UPI0015943245|nr:hypothetical protein [Flavobacterium sp. J49]MBF6642488.1 hypothetical protein [Flavobacterium sp. J49]NIC03734.1 hypothetical protein [Flavobacterium sp. J49]